MATRTVQGTLDTFSVNTGSDVTYEGAGAVVTGALISGIQGESWLYRRYYGLAQSVFRCDRHGDFPGGRSLCR